VSTAHRIIEYEGRKYWVDAVWRDPVTWDQIQQQAIKMIEAQACSQ
jgi:hypothetical protein